MNHFYIVETQKGEQIDIHSTHGSFVSAMRAAERLLSEFNAVNVTFVEKTLCKRWENAKEVPTRGL